MMTADDRALNVRLPSELYEQLRRYAFEKRRSQADVIREALRMLFQVSELPANGD